MTRPYLFVGLAVLVGLGLVSCEDRTRESSLAHSQRALAPVGSAPLDVGPISGLTWAGGYPFACGKDSCLSVYVASVRNSSRFEEGDWVAGRFDREGNWLSQTPLLFPRVASEVGPREFVWVAAQGQDFLVGQRKDAGTAVYRVRADGNVSLIGTDPQFYYPPACVTADRLVFAVAGFARVYASDLSPIGPGGNVDADQGVLGTNSCLVYSYGQAIRLRLSDGAVLDSPQIVPTRYLAALFVGHAYKAGTFVIGGYANGQIYAIRIRESDGVVLDADDVFNQRTGAKNWGVTSSTGLQIDDWGDELLATWTQTLAGQPYTVAARIDVNTGEPIEPAAPLVDSAVGGPVFLTRSSALFFGQPGLTSFSVQPGPPVTLTQTAVRPSNYVSWVERPALAASTTQYLVAWQAWQTGSTIRASRISAEGHYLNDPTLEIGTGHDVGVASNGTDFLVAWLQDDKLMRRWVRANGSADALLTPIDIAGANATKSAHLLFGGNRFAYSWLNGTQLNVVRLDAAGGKIDSTLIASDVGSYSTAVDASRTPDRRSFAFAYRASSGIDSGSNFVRLLHAETGIWAQPTLLIGSGTASSPQLPPLAASDGTLFAINHQIGFDAGGRSLIDPISVSLTPSNYVETGTAAETSFWFDGKDYLLLEQVGSSSSVRRFQPDLAAVDRNVAGSGTPLKPAVPDYSLNYVATASLGDGKSLIAYPALDLSRYGGAIKLRVIENDGLKAPVDSGESGAGGMGGVPGGTGGAAPGSNGGSSASAGSTASGGAPQAGTSQGGEAGVSEAGTAGNANGGTTTGAGGTTPVGGTAAGAAAGNQTTEGGSTGITGGAPSTDAGAPASGGTADATQGGTPATGGGANPTSGGGRVAAGGSATSGSAMGGATGKPSSNDSPGDDGGCGCRITPQPSQRGISIAALGALLLLARRRRNRT